MFEGVLSSAIPWLQLQEEFLKSRTLTNLITVGAVPPELLLGRQIALTERDSFLGAFLVLLPESPTVTGQYHCGKVLHSPSVLFHNTFSSSASGKAVGFGAPKAQADRSKEENML